MFKYLVVIESPGKVSKIQSFLGKDYKVVASVGHIKGLPPKKLGIDIKNNFEPEYVVLPGKNDIIQNIKLLAKRSEMVYIATDLDREGEGIGYHISNILPTGTKYKRITYGAVTKNEILNGIKNARDIDHYLVQGYESRLILDRLVGFKCSYLVKQAASGKSAGRVQSAALKILTEKEKSIQGFIPQEYWEVVGTFKKDNGEIFKAGLKNPNKLKIDSQEESNKICKGIELSKFVISKFEDKDVNITPYPPFTTSTLYQTAGALFGWDSSRTASVAQKLYNESYITYIRTDCPHISIDAVDCIRNDIVVKYGSQYRYPSVRLYASKGSAQEAHECIRPTNIENKSINFSSVDEIKLYDLISRRTSSCQMSNMIKSRRSIEIDGSEYIFSASGSSIKFDGFARCWKESISDDVYLPEFEVGESVSLIDIESKQKFTQPPARYTEQSLIKELEKKGIGRPSTYAGIMKKLIEREYIEKSGRSLITTSKGIGVCDFLENVPFCFMNYDFTKQMEDDIDKISNNKKNKNEMLSDFWKRLSEDILKAKEGLSVLDMVGRKCPECGGDLIYKRSQYGKFIACSNYKSKKCKHIETMNEDGTFSVAERKEHEYSIFFKCPKCFAKMIKRKGKKIDFWGCEKYPKCRGMRDMSGEEMEFNSKKKYKKKGKKT